MVAPFYYKRADLLVFYVEGNMNEMNQLKPLELPEDPDEVTEDQEEEKVPEGTDEKASQNDEEPVIEDVIDSLAVKPEAAAQPAPVIGGENDDFENLAQDIFENFGLCEQILNDFQAGDLLKDASLTDEQKNTRNKVTSALKIDTTLRRADFAKFYQDLDSSMADYSEVINICKQFPEGNERIMGSAFFALGQIHLESNRREEALTKFLSVESILKQCMFTKLKEAGQSEIDTAAEVSVLIQPSIFDDDKIKELKSSLADVQEYITECKQLENIQPQLDQMKKEAQEAKEQAENGVDTSVPEGFGETQKDADTFRKAPLLRKKRKVEEISGGPAATEDND